MCGDPSPLTGGDGGPDGNGPYVLFMGDSIELDGEQRAPHSSPLTNVVLVYDCSWLVD